MQTPVTTRRAVERALFLAALALVPAARADEALQVRLPGSWALFALDAAMPEPRSPEPDFSAAIAARKSYSIPALEIVGFDFLLNQYDRHHFPGDDFSTNLRSIRRNLRSSWVVDRDPFLVNQLGHPYQGSMYHGFARASGLNFWEAFAYTFAGSAFWEIAGETTPPSRNDQITTGIGGTFLGEALFRMANLALEHDNLGAWREVAAAIVSPPVGFNRLAFGDRFRLPFPSRGPVYFTRLQLGFSGSEPGDMAETSTVKLSRNEALADFFIDYGLPGKQGYEYTRPFDYFSFQATASSANGFENVLTKGLLVGRDYQSGENLRGIWGLYGNYDYIAPQTFRVSSTGLSLGTTAQWRITHSIDLLASLLGGVGYTAAGTILSSAQNDYHHGVAPQALAALRLVFGGRAAIDVVGREYYVSRVAAAARGGHENIARLDAALTIRIHKQHGLTIKYLGNRRDAHYPDTGGITQKRETVGIFYTLLGHDRFGAVEWR